MAVQGVVDERVTVTFKNTIDQTKKFTVKSAVVVPSLKPLLIFGGVIIFVGGVLYCGFKKD